MYLDINDRWVHRFYFYVYYILFYLFELMLGNKLYRGDHLCVATVNQDWWK